MEWCVTISITIFISLLLSSASLNHLRFSTVYLTLLIAKYNILALLYSFLNVHFILHSTWQNMKHHSRQLNICPSSRKMFSVISSCALYVYKQHFQLKFIDSSHAILEVALLEGSKEGGCIKIRTWLQPCRKFRYVDYWKTQLWVFLITLYISREWCILAGGGVINPKN